MSSSEEDNLISVREIRSIYTSIHNINNIKEIELKQKE